MGTSSKRKTETVAFVKAYLRQRIAQTELGLEALRSSGGLTYDHDIDMAYAKDVGEKKAYEEVLELIEIYEDKNILEFRIGKKMKKNWRRIR